MESSQGTKGAPRDRGPVVRVEGGAVATRAAVDAAVTALGGVVDGEASEGAAAAVVVVAGTFADARARQGVLRAIRPEGFVLWLVTAEGGAEEIPGEVVLCVAPGGAPPVATVQAHLRAPLALARAHERLAAADGTDPFLAALSHELRTPLNAILGWTKLLRAGSLDAERAKAALAIVDRNARAQAQIVSDLLDVSRIKAGKIHLERAPVDVAELAALLIDDFRPNAAAVEVAVRALRGGAAPPVVLGDRGRLVQVLTNLVGNAVKFAARGGHVTLSVRGDEDVVTASVIDDGPGIAPELLPRLFEPFRQGDGSLTRSAGGLGLGLAIVQSLVALHGGSVAVTSTLGAGATFTVTLPRHRGAGDGRDRGPITQEFGEDRRLRGRLVLVVDDDDDGGSLTATLLAERGADVVRAARVDEALARIAEERFDAVVTDLAMPERDGFALLAALRSAPETDALPIVALTAFAAAEDRRRCLEAGFDDHVPKPVSAGRLLGALADALERRRVRRRSD